MIRNLEDSTPFLLVIKKSVREKNHANISLFTGDRYHIGCMGLGKIHSYNQETKCEDKALEVTSALWKVEE